MEGVYHFSVQVRTFRLDEEQSAILYLYKNGASMVLLHLSRLGHADGAVYDLKDRTFSGTATVKLAAGDRITVMMSSTDSSYSTWGYPHFSASFTNFSGHRVH